MRVPGGQRRIGGITECAVQLDRRVDNFVDHIGEEDFGDAILLTNVEPVLGLVGDVHQHQTRDVELARAFRQHELNALAVFQAFAEGGALGDMRGGKIERALRHGDIVHAVTQATVSEPVLTHGKALTLAAEQILFRHNQIVD